MDINHNLLSPFLSKTKIQDINQHINQLIVHISNQSAIVSTHSHSQQNLKKILDNHQTILEVLKITSNSTHNHKHNVLRINSYQEHLQWLHDDFEFSNEFIQTLQHSSDQL